MHDSLLLGFVAGRFDPYALPLRPLLSALVVAVQHLIDEPNFELQSFASINEERITSGTLNLIRVPPSQLGLATLNKHPLILAARLPLTSSPRPLTVAPRPPPRPPPASR